MNPIQALASRFDAAAQNHDTERKAVAEHVSRIVDMLERNQVGNRSFLQVFPISVGSPTRGFSERESLAFDGILWTFGLAISLNTQFTKYVSYYICSSKAKRTESQLFWVRLHQEAGAYAAPAELHAFNEVLFRLAAEELDADPVKALSQQGIRVGF